MKNLIITIALVLCIFGVFMIKLNYEASTIPEVEKWWYSSYGQTLEVFAIYHELEYYESIFQIKFPITIRIISEDAKDTIDITWEMLEKVFKKED